MEIFIQLIINSLIAGATYSLVALGFNLIYGATRFFNLAHGVMAAFGGYAVFFFYHDLGMNIYVSIFFGIILAGILGYLLNFFIYSKLRKRKASNLVLLVASLGAFTVLQAILSIVFTSQFRPLSKEVGVQKMYEFFGGSFTEIQLITFISSFVVFVFLHLMLKKTLFGKAIKAINDDEEVSKIIGINTNKIIGQIFFIGSAIAGLAGILVGFDTGIVPIMGLPLLLKGVIASIIGGVGSLYGGVLGAFLLAFVENFGIWKIASEWKDAIAFCLLIVFLIFRPEGIIKK